MEQLHAIVNGRVQGVGFRYFVLESANQHGLNGWVRNRFDGTVEVMAEGEREALEMLLQDLWQGPRSSFVENVKVDWSPATQEFERFSVRGLF